jgi:glycosyltransferase involved in cell wall biosynthesis
MRMTGVSGSENHLLELTRGLRDEAWRSDVLIPTPEPAAVRQFANRLSRSADDVDLMRMRSDASPALLRHLVGALRSGRYTVAHAHLVHADWHLAVAGALVPGTPLVTTKHNPDPFRATRAFRALERITLRRYAAVIAISDHLREFLAATVGAQAITVRYGLSAGADAPQRDRRELRRLVAVGRLEAQKGFDVAIEAMRSIAGEVPGVQLQIAGDGRLRSGLESTIERYGIQQSVRLLGRVEDVHELMREADLFVHTARWEGFGLVLLEAMRAGLPIVATRVGAIPEIVEDGVTGVLVPPDDAGALAEAVLGLVSDPTHARELGLAGFARLRAEFSADAMGRRTARVYDAVLEAR